jgi:DDE domain
VDETDIKAKGICTDLYRAVDCLGQTIDIPLSVRRDAVSAKRFFRKALARPRTVNPRTITVDKNPAYDESKRNDLMVTVRCLYSAALLLATVVCSSAQTRPAQDAQARAVGNNSKLFGDIANDSSWADLAVSCRLRNESWTKLIHEKATLSILLLDEALHLDGPHRDALGTAMHSMATDVARRNDCSKVTPYILHALDEIAVTP